MLSSPTFENPEPQSVTMTSMVQLTHTGTCHAWPPNSPDDLLRSMVPLGAAEQRWKKCPLNEMPRPLPSQHVSNKTWRCYGGRSVPSLMED